MAYKIVINQNYGYHEVKPKPGAEELRQYYEDKYYQNESASYTHSYAPEELTYFNTKIEQKDYILNQLLPIESNEVRSLLDIGCGEGFTLDYFHKMGWEVQGIDFSDFGIRAIHPHMVPYLKKGNIWETIEELVTLQKKYHVVILDNVLEHVVDPGALLVKAHALTKPGGILIIEVPNDFSAFQNALLESEKIKVKYWEAYPDHLIYFSRESLISLCDDCNWKTEKIIADFPIEWFLMNDHSNYSQNKSLGKQAHASRVFLENFLDLQIKDKSKLIEFYESMSKIGQGRQIVGFFRREMSYKALKQKKFSHEEYELITIREEDMEAIRLWRNAQMAVLRQKSEISTEAQKIYFQQVLYPLFTNPEPTQMLFSFIENGSLIGYGGLVNISWQDRCAEMSFLLNPEITSDQLKYKHAMTAFISLIKKIFFKEMQFNRLFTETYEFRMFHISILVENGFIEEGRMRQHIFEFGKFHDSILHSILRENYVEP